MKFLYAALALCLCLPATLFAAEPTLAEYKDSLIQYSILIGAHNAAERLEALPEESWQFLYSTDANKEELVGVVLDLQRITNEKRGKNVKNPSMLQSIDTSVQVDGEFEPKYPDTDEDSSTCAGMASACYAWYIRHDVLGIPNGLFTDDTDEPGIQDDRCDEQMEAVLNGSYDSVYEMAIASQAACDSSLDAFAWATCGLITLPLWELVHETEQRLRVCGLHGGNVDSAESEAAYENTRTILDVANSIENETEIIETTITNKENFTDDVELNSHNAEVLSAISDLNDRLTVIEGKLDVQQTQLGLVIELLETPQGRRPDWNENP